MLWLVFDISSGPCVILQPAPHLLHARLVAGMTRRLDPQTFIEGHQLDKKLIKQIPKDMIGKCLSSKQAARLLKKLA